MATIDQCFNIDYTNKRVYDNQSNPDIFTVRALYTYLMNQFDELAQMDDTIPMSAQTPNAYTLLNGWFMPDASFKYLEEGAVTTSGQLNEIQLIKLDNVSADPVAGDIGKQVEAGAVAIGPLLAYEIDNYGANTGKWWVRTGSGTAIAEDSAMTIADSATGIGDASAASIDGENLWTNVYTLGTIQTDDTETIYLIQDGAKLTNGGWYSSGHIDILVKVREMGPSPGTGFINGGIITVFLRHYPDDLPVRGNADLYDHFEIDLSNGGRNAVPLATSPDLNNVKEQELVATYSDIEIAFVNGTISYSAISGAFTDYEEVTQATTGATGIFLKQTTLTGLGVMTLGNIVGTFDDNHVITGSTSAKTATASSTVTIARTVTKHFEQGSDFDYSVCIHCNNHRLSDVYQYLKYVTRETSTFQTYPTKMLTSLSIDAKDGEQYEAAFRDYDTLGLSFSAVKASPFGTFAGGTFFGARGVWIEEMNDLDIQLYQLVDADNATQLPPTYASITISNLLAEDKVSVFRTVSGTTIKKDVYHAAANNTSGNETFVVTETITSDTPSAGVIRIVDTSDTGPTRETRYSYTSWATSTFSGIKQLPDETAGLDRTYSATDPTDTSYVPFIDTEAITTSASVSVIFYTDRTILVRVRRYAPEDPVTGPILPFQTTDTFGSSGYSTSAIRTSDAIVL